MPAGCDLNLTLAASDALRALVGSSVCPAVPLGTHAPAWDTASA